MQLIVPKNRLLIILNHQFLFSIFSSMSAACSSENVKQNNFTDKYAVMILMQEFSNQISRLDFSPFILSFLILLIFSIHAFFF